MSGAGFDILMGDCLEQLPKIDPGSVQTCVTSPPYWGLRDYGSEEQLGLERTPDEYVGRMVEVFRQVGRALRDDGTLWLNLGDSYSGAGLGGGIDSQGINDSQKRAASAKRSGVRPIGPGLKPKDLVGIPWRVAFALQADGWWIRSDIIWHKPNPMPESVTDRPTKSHEYLFLLTKSARYRYDADAIREPAVLGPHVRDRSSNFKKVGSQDPRYGGHLSGQPKIIYDGWRNKRSVWSITTKPYSGAHFATMPPALVEPCIKAGSSPGDLVLDPFSGAGTVGLVANRLGRSYVGIEINPDYAAMSTDRIVGDAPLFNRAGGG